MAETNNPYQASDVRAEADELRPGESLVLAGHGQRFANLFIDYFAQMGLGFVVGILIVLIGGEAAISFIEDTPDILLGLPILIIYYFAFEMATSRTLGKLITGTKVVNEDGGPPTPTQIMGRTICRIIPFEFLTFLRTPSRGWHDSIPNTYVVKTR